MNFVAVDFETANSNRSSACSLGVAIVSRGEIIDSAEFLIKPTPNYFESFHTSLHGIGARHVQGVDTFTQQWNDLRIYFEDLTVIAHNAAFDVSVLRAVLDVEELDYPDMSYHCTYQLAKKSLPQLWDHGLSGLAQYFKISLNHHNAESDAIACANIALKLAEHQGCSSLDELSKKLGFNPGVVNGSKRNYKPFSKAK